MLACTGGALAAHTLACHNPSPGVGEEVGERKGGRREKVERGESWEGEEREWGSGGERRRGEVEGREEGGGGKGRGGERREGRGGKRREGRGERGRRGREGRGGRRGEGREGRGGKERGERRKSEGKGENVTQQKWYHGVFICKSLYTQNVYI